MTTFEEIRICRRANRRFHNQAVRFRIALYRDHALRYRKRADIARMLSLKLTGIQRVLRERSASNFLDDAKSQPCGLCHYCYGYRAD